MINNDINHERSQQEREAFLLFCMMVAGKNAQLVLNKVNAFCEDADPNDDGIFSAMQQLDSEGLLEELVYKHKLGNYKRFLKFARESKPDVENCSIDELEQLHGIGPKTARFFVSFTRPNQRFAILDRHVLAWLRERGVKAPKNTPTQREKYAELEKTYLELVGDGDPTQTDFQIWSSKRRECKCQNN